MNRLKNIKVSIIVPVYNEESIIEGQLRRLFAVTDDGTEVIAVDGGSTDKTACIIEALKGVTLLRSPRKRRAFQMNYGASFAEGNLLLFLHADAALPAGWKSEIISAMENGFVAGGFRIRCGKHEALSRSQKFFAFLSGIR